ncbi:MAG: DUF116 domain-containing protein [Firmicutes bacterium]|nr:DUF116 domain-containing protein [Bacillota bacterium]
MQVKKRIFLGALLTGIFIISGIGVLFWYFTFREPGKFTQSLFFLLGLVLFLGVLLTFGGVLGIVFSLLTGKSYSFFRLPSQLIIAHLLPLVIRLGKIFHIAKERVELSFIEVNNALVKSQIRRSIKPEEILVLAPHCLQNSECVHRITTDINNCRRCGRCRIADLLELQDEYGVKVAVVTGGTLARRVVRKFRPQAIVAIACERDLSSGIQDVHPLPALGIVNIRPQGPCFNTQVDITRVREGLEFLLAVEKV